MEKQCFKCRKTQPLFNFYKHAGMADKHLNKCKACTKKDVKRRYHDPESHSRIVEYDRSRQRTSFKRIFNSRYTSMQQRVTGTASRRYAVLGRSIATREDFLAWCYLPDILVTFKKLHKQWEGAYFDRKTAPSIDRINNKGGYTVDNLRWITQQENSEKYTKEAF